MDFKDVLAEITTKDGTEPASQVEDFIVDLLDSKHLDIGLSRLFSRLWAESVGLVVRIALLGLDNTKYGFLAFPWLFSTGKLLVALVYGVVSLVEQVDLRVLLHLDTVLDRSDVLFSLVLLLNRVLQILQSLDGLEPRQVLHVVLCSSRVAQHAFLSHHVHVLKTRH